MKRLLLDLDSYGGNDPLGMGKQEDSKGSRPSSLSGISAAPSLGSFPVCWRVANVTPNPMGPPSSSASNYRPISLTPILSKVFERLVSVRRGRFMECRGVLPTTQLAYRKGDALLCVAHTLQSAFKMEQEARIVQIGCSAAFDRVNHHGILFKLYSVGVGGSVLSVLTQFLSNRSQYVVVDGCRSKLVNMVPGVPQ